MLIKWTQCFIYKVCMWIALGLSMSSHSIDKSSIEESVYSRVKRLNRIKLVYYRIKVILEKLKSV